MRRINKALLGFIGAATLTASVVGSSLAATADSRGSITPLSAAGPLVIGHRGAGGYVPEHTLASYALAIDQGAEPPSPTS